VGSTTTSHGNLNISGANSTLFSSTNTLVVGFNGTGVLSISGGGNATAPNIFVGASALGHGNATVSGTGSLFQTNGTLAVGLSSNGALTITNGGDALSGTGVIGSNAGSVGNATIAGVGSSWTNSGNFTLGGNGTGFLTLADGGLLSTSNFTITNNGTLNFGLAGITGGLDYGEIDISGNATFGGTFTTFFTSGFNPVDGESFHLFAFGPGALISGNFSTYNLPSLDPGLSWDTTGLLTSGNLSVVPEPAVYGLWVTMAALSVVAIRRKNR
jgi:T5SS/PEP-CTERM-associated repeat protein